MLMADTKEKRNTIKMMDVKSISYGLINTKNGSLEKEEYHNLEFAKRKAQGKEDLKVVKVIKNTVKTMHVEVVK